MRPFLQIVISTLLAILAGKASGSALIQRLDCNVSSSEELSVPCAEPVTLAASTAPQLDFSSSTWIWTADGANGANALPGLKSLRKSWTPPQGKTPDRADILITADNSASLYVNGNEIPGSISQWLISSRYCVRGLSTGLNVFAVQATNGGQDANPAGVLAAIQVTYSDGTTSIIPSDVTWRANVHTTDMEKLSYDDSAWSPASSAGKYGSSPWGTINVVGVDALSFQNAFWIWTNEISDGASPQGPRVFRRTIQLPNSRDPATANVLITADNQYVLYVNGVRAGSGDDWQTPSRYVINNIIGPKVVFAVYAYNLGLGDNGSTSNPAGVLASIQISYGEVADCRSTQFIVTDENWKYSTQVLPDWYLPEYDDSAWNLAIPEASYGSGVWGNLAIPTTVASKIGPKVQGAPEGI